MWLAPARGPVPAFKSRMPKVIAEKMQPSIFDRDRLGERRYLSLEMEIKVWPTTEL